MNKLRGSTSSRGSDLLITSSSPPPSRVSHAARVGYLIQVLFTFVCLVIFIDIRISRSTLSVKSRIERAICPDYPPLGSLRKGEIGMDTDTADTTSSAALLTDSDTISSPVLNKKQVATFVITCGTAETDAINEMSALLKSLLLLASEPVRLIFITDSKGAYRLWKTFAQDLVESKRQLWVDIHLLQDSIVDAWASKISLDPVGHHSGRWGTAKLMLPWILKDFNRIVVLDTDMVFVEDPIRLWELFEDGEEEWIYKMPVSNKNHFSKMCSCIVLIKMDLARRKDVFPTLFQQALISGPETWWIAEREHWRPETGDQGLYWLMMKKYPDLFKILPNNWDKDRCHKFWGALEPTSRDRVSLIHRNCGGQNSATVKDRASPFFDFFLHYRWHWLTPQSGKSFAVQVRNFTVGPVL